MQYGRLIISALLLFGCVSGVVYPDNLIYTSVSSGGYQIATWARMTDTVSPVHVYIEGDGHSFDSRGRPTSDPTPRSTFVRDLASQDTSPNVVYMGRPCQYIMSSGCNRSDWTDGRFSMEIIGAVSGAISSVVGDRPVILIGYSGGAMVSGLVITHHPELDVQKWITIAGVLNHADWTAYFGDKPLKNSLNMEQLPTVPQLHYIARRDSVVPNVLSYKWVPADKIVLESDATHSVFPTIKISF